MDLIRARIFSRRGLFERSLKIYEKLRERYPGDEEIWEDYIETLVDFKEYDPARAELEKLLGLHPGNERGQRIRARIYHELKQYEWAYPVYEDLLLNRPNDAGLWSDYAYARLGAGDWAPALNYFSRVLEIAPDNGDALRSLQDILREHRPRLETGFRRYRLLESESVLDTCYLNYFRQLSAKTALRLGYNQVRISRPPSEAGAGIDHVVNDANLVLDYRLNRRWGLSGGAGLYTGLGGDLSGHLGLDYQPRTNMVIRAEYDPSRPWYDPVEAALYNGQSDRLHLAFDWASLSGWALLVDLEQWDYRLRSHEPYGRKRDADIVLTRRLWTEPRVTLSYSFYRSEFDYENRAFTPVAMIESEGIHSLIFRFEHRPYAYLTYSLSAALRRDEVRDLDSWFLIPELRFRLGNRIELSLLYECSSESETVGGGRSDTLQASLNIIL